MTPKSYDTAGAVCPPYARQRDHIWYVWSCMFAWSIRTDSTSFCNPRGLPPILHVSYRGAGPSQGAQSKASRLGGPARSASAAGELLRQMSINLTWKCSLEFSFFSDDSNEPFCWKGLFGFCLLAFTSVSLVEQNLKLMLWSGFWCGGEIYHLCFIQTDEQLFLVCLDSVSHGALLTKLHLLHNCFI